MLRISILVGALAIVHFVAGCRASPLLSVGSSESRLATSGSRASLATSAPGDFDFEGHPIQNVGRGVDVALKYEWDPSVFGPPACNCGKVVFVQIVRAFDTTTGALMALPWYEQRERAVSGSGLDLDGWAVDQFDGFQWAFYGSRKSRDPPTFNSDYCVPGNSTTPARLEDFSGGWPDYVLFEAVSVAVCISTTTATCANKPAAYKYWGFETKVAPMVVGPYSSLAALSHEEAFAAAKHEWNIDAPTFTPSKKPLP